MNRPPRWTWWCRRTSCYQIARLREMLGLSILFITHDLSLLVEFSTRILIMYAGEIRRGCSGSRAVR